MSISARNLHRRASPANFHRYHFTAETQKEVLQRPTVTSECNRHSACKHLIHDSIHLCKILHIELKMKATCQYERLPKKTVTMEKVGIMRWTQELSTQQSWRVTAIFVYVNKSDEKSREILYIRAFLLYYDFSGMPYQIMAPKYSHFKEDFKKKKKIQKVSKKSC